MARIPYKKEDQNSCFWVSCEGRSSYNNELLYELDAPFSLKFEVDISFEQKDIEEYADSPYEAYSKMIQEIGASLFESRKNTYSAPPDNHNKLYQKIAESLREDIEALIRKTIPNDFEITKLWFGLCVVRGYIWIEENK